MNIKRLTELISTGSIQNYYNNNCTTMTQSIISMYIKGEKLPKDTLNMYFNTFSSSNSLYGGEMLQYINTFTYIFESYIPSDKHIIGIFKNCTKSEIVKKKLAQSFTILQKFGYSFKNETYKIISKYNKYIIVFLWDGFIKNTSNLSFEKHYIKQISDYDKNNTILKRFLSAKALLEYNILYDLSLSLKTLQYDRNKLSLLYKFTGEDSIVNNIVKIWTPNSILKFLKEFKIRCTTDNVKKIIKRSHIYGYSADKINLQSANNIIAAFIKYGYIPDKDIVLYSIGFKHVIKDVEKYVKIDDDIANECVKNNFFPYDLSNCNINKNVLYDACNIYRNLDNVKRIISYGIKPDSKCLELSCENNDFEIILYLLNEYNLRLNKKCYEGIFNKCIRNNEIKNLMLENINKDLNIEYNDFIVKNYKKKKIELKQEIVEHVNEADNNTESDNDIESDNDTETEYMNDTLEFKTISSCININKKQPVTKLMIKFFSLPKKSKLSFNEVRMKFMQYVSDKDLINDVYFIKINKYMNNMLKLKKDKYIHISDIDSVIMLFY